MSKIIFGWLIDTINKTIHLPSHRADQLLEILHSIPPSQKSIATKEWHKVIGKLQSMSVAILGCTGLFSILQEAVRHEDKSRNCICLSTTLHEFLDDFRWLAQDLVLRPTRIAELVPDQEPATNGQCDAAAAGMDSVYFVTTNTTKNPIFWQQ